MTELQYINIYLFCNKINWISWNQIFMNNWIKMYVIGLIKDHRNWRSFDYTDNLILLFSTDALQFKQAYLATKWTHDLCAGPRVYAVMRLCIKFLYHAFANYFRSIEIKIWHTSLVDYKWCEQFTNSCNSFREHLGKKFRILCLEVGFLFIILLPSNIRLIFFLILVLCINIILEIITSEPCNYLLNFIESMKHIYWNVFKILHINILWTHYSSNLWCQEYKTAEA